MPLLRTLSHAVLALALMADGLASGGMAMTKMQTALPDASAVQADAQTESGASKHGSCHEEAASTSDADAGTTTDVGIDCCDDATCSCSCLQLAPAAFMAISIPDALRFALIPQLGRLVSLPGVPLVPQLRPPIA